MVMEGPFGHRSAVIVVRTALPATADVLQRDVPSPVDGVDQPYVPVEIVLRHILCFRCHSKKGRHIPAAALVKL